MASVTYLDYDSETESFVSRINECISVLASDTSWGTAGETTYYVVDSNITISHTVDIVGDVYLILQDGCSLTVTGTAIKAAGYAGIHVTNTGSEPNANSITICGQTQGTGALTATGSQTDYNGSGAGIGGNWGEEGSNITINGGTVTATGGKDSPGIGGGFQGDGKNITINGGKVTARGFYYSAGIGGGSGNGAGTTGSGAASNICINGGIVYAYCARNDASGIGCGAGSTASNITIKGTMGVKADDNATPTTVIAHESSTDLSAALSGQRYVSILEAVDYIDADGSLRSCNDYTLVKNQTTWGVAGQDTWYVVEGNVTINNGVNVLGNVHLILKDGCSITCDTNATHADKAGIIVSASGNNTFTVYGQTKQTGTLTVKGDSTYYSAGLGGTGTSNKNSGSITINGGRIYATSGSGGAAIGGGHNSYGANITFNRGYVEATTIVPNGSAIGSGGIPASYPAHDIYVSRDLTVRAGNTADPTTLIEHTSDTDLANALAGKQYVIIGGSIKVLNVNWTTGEQQTVTFKNIEYTQTVGNGYFFNQVSGNDGFQAARGTKLVIEGTLTATEQGAGYDYEVRGGTFTKMFVGGEIITSGVAPSANDAYSVVISGGTFEDSIATGDGVNAGINVSRTGNLTTSISGGTFEKRVAGGMYYASSSAEGSATLNGDVNLTISGGTFAGRIMGGNNARTDALGAKTVITGNVNVVVNATSAIEIQDSLMAGSRGKGEIGGDVTVTFSGDGGNLTFDTDSVVFGGCGGDSIRLKDDGTTTLDTSITGDRVLVFDDFEGEFGAEIRMFDTATFTNGSNVEFTDENLDMWAVSTWEFQFGSSASGLADNLFKGDTLNFDMEGYDNNDWTVLSGEAKAFEDLKDATAVFFGASTAHKVYDEVETDKFLYWSDDTYKLSVETSTTTDLVLSKIA